MLFRDGRMVSGQQNSEGGANVKGGDADAPLSRKLARMAGGGVRPGISRFTAVV
jgi:hypothetical protein